MVDCQNAINDREAKEQLAFQSIEDRLCCIGVTGVEDRLVAVVVKIVLCFLI